MRTLAAAGLVLLGSLMQGCVVWEIRDQVRDVNTQLTTVDQRLASTNDALTAVNAELTSVNGELDQVKTDLQSTNAELGTVKTQLKDLETIKVSLARLDDHLASLRKTIAILDETVPFLDLGGGAPPADEAAQSTLVGADPRTLETDETPDAEQAPAADVPAPAPSEQRPAPVRREAFLGSWVSQFPDQSTAIVLLGDGSFVTARTAAADGARVTLRGTWSRDNGDLVLNYEPRPAAPAQAAQQTPANQPPQPDSERFSVVTVSVRSLVLEGERGLVVFARP